MAKIVKQKYAQVAVDDLEPHPQNPRRGHIGKITESIDSTGFYGTLVAQKSTGHVLVGNHRLMVLRAQGVKTVPVMWLDVDDDEARKILVNDNKASEFADWDDRRLAELLQDSGIEGTLVSQDEFEGLLRESGLLGDAAAGFLDDFTAAVGDDDEGDDEEDRPEIRTDGTRGPVAPEEQYYSMAYTVTGPDRDSINQAIKKAKADHDVGVSGEALAEICRDYLKENDQ